MKQLISLALCTSLLSACATGPQLSRGAAVQTTATPAAQTAVAEFARSLSPGTRVSMTLDSGTRVRGTLMKVTDQALVLQPRTRVPEAPLDIPLAQVKAIELDQHSGTSLGKAIAIGAGVGAAATLGVLMIFAALYAD